MNKIPAFYELAIIACAAIIALTIIALTIATTSCTGGVPITSDNPNLVTEYPVAKGVWRMHDDANKVTCYLYYDVAISCLSDTQIGR